MGSDIYGKVQVRTGSEWQDVSRDRLPEELFDRNYAMFAVLADFRNGYGVPAISPPRGAPEEEEPQERLVYESWVLLSELLDYDWEGPAWQQEICSIGETYPLHALTQGWRKAALPALQALGEPEDVRFVFGFDQ